MSNEPREILNQDHSSDADRYQLAETRIGRLNKIGAIAATILIVVMIINRVPAQLIVFMLILIGIEVLVNRESPEARARFLSRYKKKRNKSKNQEKEFKQTLRDFKSTDYSDV